MVPVVGRPIGDGGYALPILDDLGNERAAKAAARRAQRNALMTPQERMERDLENMSDTIVASVLVTN